ncbi:MAG TPA: phosphomethylpyrimidine synthase [Deltaproteobacteria bacterium]|nr:MAG: phosphomethylpyrimidine synthase [Deltaproteobacteria bacterium GWA2_65_63]OGP27141.1 MAG: phosphomethylpyrimidine synthase [Deltaproteobacteria bacterium GWB2_65_81]OGP38405.1 MAG: phosphomethylpyrimidine synthase [Deltaproteobacteria bacterium GWC2_66_88]HAM33288.1 phosphomethylpyrimidine synthase [Deltaproteobacteria bacterium]HBG73255.1 phosphomethylpyrimidine synthase [Deltaproteobacteria bacterium]
MTLMHRTRQGEIPRSVALAAESERVDPAILRDRVAAGKAVIPRNRKRREIRSVAIGEGLLTKVNANVGSSRDRADLALELEKMRVAVAAGADAVMDLSTGGPIDEIRRAILAECPVPVGTVPLYQAAADGNLRGKSWVELTEDDFFAGIEKQAEDGVDFMTVHCGVTREALDRLVREGRRLDIVSRGGSLLAEWMRYHGKENPFYERYDRLLAICREYDITLSLGDGLRPGCLADATDRAQVHELMTLGELTDRAWEKDVQVMIEGPGHVPMHQIAANMAIQKRLCHGAPFYVLGPLVTDIAPGYDHITSAIGGAIAAWNGADFLCYVTPSEHLRLPPVEDVREGVIATRIAAHAADIARGIPGAMDRDDRMADARRALDWKTQIELSIDPERARSWRGGSLPTVDEAVCTMCADLCAIKTSRKAIRNE